MPAEILNRLESSVPQIKASVANARLGSPIRADASDSLKSEMRAMKFIWNLPIIDLEFLHDDEKFCGLCNGKYENEFRVCGRGESPCCLPCGHIIGHQVSTLPESTLPQHPFSSSRFKNSSSNKDADSAKWCSALGNTFLPTNADSLNVLM